MCQTINSQNLIIDPGFEVGYQLCTTVNGVPDVVKNNVIDCNYCYSIGSCVIDNKLTFDMESAHWKEGKHNWGKKSHFVYWVKEN
jgi:hypothetical protein